MKTSVKVWLAAAVILIAAGAVLFTVVMSAHSWNFKEVFRNKYETRSFEITQHFVNISIRSDTADIHFRKTESGNARVEIFDDPLIEASAEVQNGVLAIEIRDTRKWYEKIGFFRAESSKITLYLPEASYSSLTINESTGDIDLPAPFAFQKIDITASTGDVKLGASASGNIKIETDTGDIHAESLTAGSLELSVSTGKVTVKSVPCDGDISVRVSTGKAVLEDVICKNLISTGSTGHIELKDVKANGLLSLERSTGDIRFDKCDAEEILITTSTGDVSGSLLSDKVFVAKSDTGRVQVPETTAGGKCKVTTDTGDINITIE